MTTKAQPLSDEEFDSIADVLYRDEGFMNPETLDGFFVALICSPETVLPSEYLAEIWGGEMPDAAAFANEEEARDFFALLMRHWNAIADTLHAGDVYVPLLLVDAQGVAHGNDWAHGFMRGMQMRQEAWAGLVHDEENGGALIPIMALHYEHDEDPELRSFGHPLSEDKRLEFIALAARGVMHIYKYFAAARRISARTGRERGTFRREAAKPPRNAPCSCGSGRKYKHCCGKAH